MSKIDFVYFSRTEEHTYIGTMLVRLVYRFKTACDIKDDIIIKVVNNKSFDVEGWTYAHLGGRRSGRFSLVNQAEAMHQEGTEPVWEYFLCNPDTLKKIIQIAWPSMLEVPYL